MSRYTELMERHDPAVRGRFMIEWRIASRLLTDALKLGYAVSVDNREDPETEPSTDRKAILAAMWETDEEQLNFWKDGKCIGGVFLVQGNDGFDLISDYSVSLESLVSGAMKLATFYGA